MIKIGEFAQLTGISIHMLRNYDKIGLLVPGHIDELTGYRYYNEEQIIEANQIQVLKELGFGLKEIREIHFGEESIGEIKGFLSEKIKQKEAERQAIEAQIRKMRQALIEMEKKEESFALEVTVKQIPARKVASLRGIIHTFQEEGRLWGELFQLCETMKVKLASVDYSYEMTHQLDLERGHIEVEVQCVVEKLYKDTEKVKFFEVPSCMAATVAFKGQYTQIGKIMAYMEKWFVRSGYQMEGISFSAYYRSPGNEANPDRFITELCFPIGKKN